MYLIGMLDETTAVRFGMRSGVGSAAGTGSNDLYKRVFFFSVDAIGV